MRFKITCKSSLECISTGSSDSQISLYAISYVFKEPQPGDTVLYKNQEIKIKKVDGSVLQTNIGNFTIHQIEGRIILSSKGGLK